MPRVYDRRLPTADLELSEKSQSTRRGYWPQIYFGIAATSMATLLLELALTRVFSVVYFYHFAFLAISIALFGLGAGGVTSYLVSGLRGSLYGKLGAMATANAVLLVFCLWFLLSKANNVPAPNFVTAYFVTALPFVIAGTIISLVVADTIEQVNRVYFFALIGWWVRGFGATAEVGGRPEHNFGGSRSLCRVCRNLVPFSAGDKGPDPGRRYRAPSSRPDHLQLQVLPD